jgi:hypothetical protein
LEEKNNKIPKPKKDGSIRVGFEFKGANKEEKATKLWNILISDIDF